MVRNWVIVAVICLSLAAASHAGAPEERGGTWHALGYVPGELLVAFKADLPALTAERAHASAGAVTRREFGRLRLHHLTLPAGMTVEQGIALYASNPDVEFAEPNYRRRAAVVPNDPDFGLLWGLHNVGQVVNGAAGTIDSDIDAPEAWDLQTGSPAVVIAVIDTGVAWTHPDLAANIWTNTGEIPANSLDDDFNGFIDDVRGWDFVGGDNDPASEDDPGHGTHVAGTIAAVGDNATGLAGVMWDAQIMPLRFLDANGFGSVADEIAAINYAIDKGADIINASYGDNNFSSSEESAIAAAGAAGILFAAAAGNEAMNNDANPHYPSSYTLDNIIAVAATGRIDTLVSFSNYGLTSVDLGAPGVSVHSTVSGGTGYDFLSGTSMATPHVAGVAGLVASVDPLFTPGQIKRAILNSVDPKISLANRTVTGGRLNAFGAVGYATGADLAVTQDVDPNPVTPGDDVTITLTVTNLGLQNAADVTLDDTLPASFTYLSAVPSQGSCSGGAAVSCNVGALAVDDTATVTIVATTSTAETVNNTASAAGGVADPADPIAANNSATVSVQVGFPSGGGGGCGVIAPIGPSGPTTIAIALLVFFSPLVLAFVRRRAFRA